MRINPNVNQSIQSTRSDQNKRVENADQAKKTESLSKIQNQQANQAASVSSGLKAEISSRGKALASAHAAAVSAPDVREDRIAALKKQIQEGRYEVDAKKVADRMVDDHLAF